MANICTSCNFENLDSASVCQNCGAELAAPVKQKKPKVKQSQDPAVRRIISFVLIASTLLCLFTCILYVAGRQPLIVHNKPSEVTSISFTNTWTLWGNLFKNIIKFDFTNSNTVYLVCRILCHICGSFFYLVLTALLGFNTYLVYTKSDKAKLISVISGASGLCIILFGFLLGYFLVVTGGPSGREYIRAIPQLTVLLLLPLFAQLPLLGLMLPKKEKREKSKNNA